MSMSEVRKAFQSQIREGVNQEEIQLAHMQRVRQSLLMHRYATLKEKYEGEKSKDGK